VTVPQDYDATRVPKTKGKENRGSLLLGCQMMGRKVSSQFRNKNELMSPILSLDAVSDYGFITSSDLTWKPPRSEDAVTKRARAAGLLSIGRGFKTANGARMFLQLYSFTSTVDADAALHATLANLKKMPSAEKAEILNGPEFNLEGLREVRSFETVIDRSNGTYRNRLITGARGCTVLRVGMSAGAEPWPWPIVEAVAQLQVAKLLELNK
jgi:hypothetical protein